MPGPTPCRLILLMKKLSKLNSTLCHYPAPKHRHPNPYTAVYDDTDELEGLECNMRIGGALTNMKSLEFELGFRRTRGGINSTGISDAPFRKQEATANGTITHGKKTAITLMISCRECCRYRNLERLRRYRRAVVYSASWGPIHRPRTERR